MRATLIPLAALVLIAQSTRADDAADAKAIVEKGLKATGQKPGDKATAMTWKDKGKFSGGGFTLPYTGEYAFQGPDKYRMSISADLEGMKVTFVGVTNGAKAWQSAMGMTEEMPAEKTEYSVTSTYHMWVSSLYPLLSDKEFKLATAGEKDVNGKKTVGVKVTRDKKPAVTLFFNKDTGLLAKMETKSKDEFQMWKEVDDEVFYDDYKDVGGIKYYCKMKLVRDGKTMIESAPHDQKRAEKLDAKLFEKP
jgi:hypothetical protein